MYINFQDVFDFGNLSLLITKLKEFSPVTPLPLLLINTTSGNTSLEN